MSPLAKLIVPLATLAILCLAVVATDISPLLKVAFVVLAAPAAAMTVVRYREERR
jgi:Flp pilus assembly protein TadB